ncbi:oligosaccharide flippase family protein [Cylindrospermopsis curvispora]|uniref:Oligosaccharide flippase family protein n=1 Tax=Cylindrospermopsis curvispora GIHE-G1 TaxID=2666332 RepID=A0A7H0F1H0_9CYAN|nr:oligosaccharide flippase family protein [Cylindrospermopsis curvispora]QNP29886.1 oligosaccharide flippase family protein [Cylindrospermopsis curvispora GIHE-G1]
MAIILLLLATNRATQIFRYNLAMWLMTIRGILFTRGDRIVVGSVLGPESLAIYAIVSDVASGINFLVAQPIQPFLPVVSRLALLPVAEADPKWLPHRKLT